MSWLGWLLMLYPKAFRERFGAQILQAVEERHGFWLWPAVVWDLVRGAAVAHWQAQPDPAAVAVLAGGPSGALMSWQQKARMGLGMSVRLALVCSGTVVCSVWTGMAFYQPAAWGGGAGLLLAVLGLAVSFQAFERVRRGQQTAVEQMGDVYAGTIIPVFFLILAGIYALSCWTIMAFAVEHAQSVNLNDPHAAEAAARFLWTDWTPHNDLMMGWTGLFVTGIIMATGGVVAAMGRGGCRLWVGVSLGWAVVAWMGPSDGAVQSVAVLNLVAATVALCARGHRPPFVVVWAGPVVLVMIMGGLLAFMQDLAAQETPLGSFGARHQEALRVVQATGDQVAFWDTMARLEKDAQADLSQRPWARLTGHTPGVAGVVALQWCWAVRSSDQVNCLMMADPQEWLTTPDEAERAMATLMADERATFRP